MKLTDWRGNDYEAGTRVLYGRMSGRCVEIQEAVVLDIWTTYQCPDSYTWKRLDEGQDPPRAKAWDREAREYQDTDEFVKTESRVRLQPNGRGSRGFYRDDEDWDSATGERTPKKTKAVVLIITENITVIKEGES